MEPKTIQILDENPFFIALVKPEGLSVHNKSPSVMEQLQAADSASLDSQEGKKPVHFVNRLDQETSGLMIVAQKPDLHAALAKALDKGQKLYRALLRSPWKDKPKQTIWSWPLTDKAEGRANPQGISADRKACETRVTVLRSNQYFTEIHAEIMTGRQHQIRKHAAIANHAIVGDSRYNEEKYNNNIQKFYGNERMLLHAEKLVFTFEEKFYEFKAPINFDSFFKETN